ncbi:universal stress protein [Hymenobacter sp.]|uniref:universal stress protein n=1 Tax=Hymenobacter sp. TaxID=1898978 RepID=UPI00286B0B35|nr:universal stress protein [Hymenobacter sp.]
MKPSIVVLTDSSPAAEQARAYAAVLAAPLGAVVHLVHVYPTPPMTSRVALVMHATHEHYVRQERRALEQLAADYPVPATADTLEAGWDEAVQQALDKYRPLLLVAGLTATHGQFDEWLSNRTLPLARETGYPLLLVPAHLPAAALHPPRRLALAVEDRLFVLTPEAQAIAALFDALATEIVTVTVVPTAGGQGGEEGLWAARRSGLAAIMPRSQPHKVVGPEPAPGILRAVQELSADVVALVDVGHGWVHKLLIDSVIEQVLRATPVPVLLLSAPVDFLDE